VKGAAPYAAAMAGSVVGAVALLSSSNYKYHYEGRDYYYGDRYYLPTHAYAAKCSFQISANSSFRYEDGYKVTELVFECDSRIEECCSKQCCRRPSVPWWIILFIIVGALVISCFIVFFCLRLHKRRQMLQAQKENEEAEEVLEPLKCDV